VTGWANQPNLITFSGTYLRTISGFNTYLFPGIFLQDEKSLMLIFTTVSAAKSLNLKHIRHPCFFPLTDVQTFEETKTKIMMTFAPNYFVATYAKVGKPTSTRKGRYRYPTFEDVFQDILNTICKSVYKMDWHFMIDEDIVVESLMENKIICHYLVKPLDHNTRIPICEYEIEIECIYDSGEIVIMRQFSTREEPSVQKAVKPEKKKKGYTKWVLQETPAIKWFLIQLASKGGDLKLLKSDPYMTKATYYRNLKRCEEKGYIINGKLVRKVYV
jgi:hypothetical protein